MFKVIDTLTHEEITVYAVRENDGEIDFLVYQYGWHWYSSTDCAPVET